MSKSWPFWLDTRDGTVYVLNCFATDVEGRVVYVLNHMEGGLNITSPAPGQEGCVIKMCNEDGRIV